jgi:hypothetical protein
MPSQDDMRLFRAGLESLRQRVKPVDGAQEKNADGLSLDCY